MNHPEVLCAGVIVADHLCAPVDHLPAAGELVMTEHMMLTIGGCAGNAAVDLARMGVRSGVVGRVGNDVFGRVVADILRQHGVDVSGLTVSATAETGQTMIVNVAGQDRRFIHAFGANAEFTAADIAVGEPASATGVKTATRVLYLGGYLLLPGLQTGELTKVFARARQAGIRTVLDVAVAGPGNHRAQLEMLLPEVDVFLPNDHEAALITGESDPLRQAELFHRMGAGTAIITQGSAGSILVTDGLKLRAGVYSVPFIDGSGSGDAFDAGYIFGLLNHWPPEDCLRVASALGASCVRAVGTTPGVFTRTECEDFMKANSLVIERL